MPETKWEERTQTGVLFIHIHSATGVATRVGLPQKDDPEEYIRSVWEFPRYIEATIKLVGGMTGELTGLVDIVDFRKHDDFPMELGIVKLRILWEELDSVEIHGTHGCTLGQMTWWCPLSTVIDYFVWNLFEPDSTNPLVAPDCRNDMAKQLAEKKGEIMKK